MFSLFSRALMGRNRTITRTLQDWGVSIQPIQSELAISEHKHKTKAARQANMKAGGLRRMDRKMQLTASGLFAFPRSPRLKEKKNKYHDNRADGFDVSMDSPLCTG